MPIPRRSAVARAGAAGAAGAEPAWQRPLGHGAATCGRSGSGSGPGRDKSLKGLRDTAGWRPPEPAARPAALHSSPGPGRGCSGASKQAGGWGGREKAFHALPDNAPLGPEREKCCTETRPGDPAQARSAPAQILPASWRMLLTTQRTRKNRLDKRLSSDRRGSRVRTLQDVESPADPAALWSTQGRAQLSTSPARWKPKAEGADSPVSHTPAPLASHLGLVLPVPSWAPRASGDPAVPSRPTTSSKDN